MAKDLTDVEMLDIVTSSIAGDTEVQNTSQALDPYLHETATLAWELPILSRIDDLPEEWLDLLAWQWHADKYDLSLTLTEKRALVKRILLIHRYKGTLYAVKTSLEALEYDCEVNEYTGNHHIFDVTVAPLADGAELGDVFSRALEYINAAKAVTRHIGTFTLQVTAPDTNIYTGVGTLTGETVTVYPTTLLRLETATEYIGAGVVCDIETVLEAGN